MLGIEDKLAAWEGLRADLGLAPDERVQLAVKKLLLEVPARAPRQHAADVQIFA